MSPEMALEAKSVVKPAEIRRTEQLLNKFKSNTLGHTVNGRSLPQPSQTLYQAMVKRKRLQQSPPRFGNDSRISHTSQNSKRAIDKMLPEEKQEKVKDFTQNLMGQTGTKAGNLSMFINSMEAFHSSGHQKSSNSPVVPNATSAILTTNFENLDYKTLKETKRASGASVLKDRSSSISTFRIQREFNNNSTSPRRSKNTIEAADKAEQLIRDLTLKTQDAVQEEMQNSFVNESLPGSCKSQFALEYRMTSDRNNANFMAKNQSNVIHKSKQRGKFPIEYQTTGGSWLKDREWKRTANPSA